LQVVSNYSENLQALKQITETLLLNKNNEVPVAGAMFVASLESLEAVNQIWYFVSTTNGLLM
jgi:hypothetical protein